VLDPPEFGIASPEERIPHADCPNTDGGNWAPYQSWNALWNTQQQNYPSVQTTMPFSTNIRDQ